MRLVPPIRALFHLSAALVFSQFTRLVDLVEPVLDAAFSITGAR
jgi:hypothetical protein